LVPDTVTNDMVRQRLAELDTHTGFLLDGFPRTLAQADVLSAILAESGHKLDAVFEFSVPDDELLRRLLARGRGDDTADVIRHRLQVYRTQTAPLLAHYRRIVATINAVGPIHDITARAHRALRAIA